MRYQIIFFPFWVINCSHIDKNNSDIFITYAGHSEAERPIFKDKITEIDTKDKETEKPITVPKPETIQEAETVPEQESDVTENVVFIPNDKPVFRNEDYDNVKIDDVLNTRRVGDLMRGRVQITDTEPPTKDILFITGKNNDNIQPISKQESKHGETDTKQTKTKRNKRIDCTRLDCDNTIKSVCGAKMENNQWKYRLFRNECLFRKVNCGFQNVINRYDMVTLDNCKTIGAHFTSRPYEFKPLPRNNYRPSVINETRRHFSSRRSLSMGINGNVCDHICPVSCTEEYDPQCAISNMGQRKVFLNHCKLDQNSCLNNFVWHLRPLSECVGGKKADMNQNRGFVAWLQRVGIVDKKGKLVLS